MALCTLQYLCCLGNSEWSFSSILEDLWGILYYAINVKGVGGACIDSRYYCICAILEANSVHLSVLILWEWDASNCAMYSGLAMCHSTLHRMGKLALCLYIVYYIWYKLHWVWGLVGRRGLWISWLMTGSGQWSSLFIDSCVPKCQWCWKGVAHHEQWMQKIEARLNSNFKVMCSSELWETSWDMWDTPASVRYTSLFRIKPGILYLSCC